MSSDFSLLISFSEIMCFPFALVEKEDFFIVSKRSYAFIAFYFMLYYVFLYLYLIAINNILYLLNSKCLKSD